MPSLAILGRPYQKYNFWDFWKSRRLKEVMKFMNKPMWHPTSFCATISFQPAAIISCTISDTLGHHNHIVIIIKQLTYYIHIYSYIYIYIHTDRWQTAMSSKVATASLQEPQLFLWIHGAHQWGRWWEWSFGIILRWYDTQRDWTCHACRFSFDRCWNQGFTQQAQSS